MNVPRQSSACWLLEISSSRRRCPLLIETAEIEGWIRTHYPTLASRDKIRPNPLNTRKAYGDQRFPASETVNPERLTYPPGADGGAVDAEQSVTYLSFPISNKSYLSVAAFKEKFRL
ncbi:hypothetical protein BH18ACI4_BH18ACI4_19430 [soil metagenome]